MRSNITTETRDAERGSARTPIRNRHIAPLRPMPTPEEIEHAEKARRYRKARAERKAREDRRAARRERRESASRSGSASPRSPKSTIFSKFTHFVTGRPRGGSEDDALLASGTFLPSGSNSVDDQRERGRRRSEDGSERSTRAEGVTVGTASERDTVDDGDGDDVMLENDWDERRGRRGRSGARGKGLESSLEGRGRLTRDALRSLDDAERGASARTSARVPNVMTTSDVFRGIFPASWRTWAATASLSLACFTVGVAIGFPFATRSATTCAAFSWTDDAAADFAEDGAPAACGRDNATSDELSMLHMAMLIGAIFGAMVAGWVCDKFGRRRAVVAATAPAVAGWCSVYVNDAFSPGAIAGRVLVGVSIGLITTAAPLLLAEAAPKALRGAHSILPHMAIVKGVAFMYAVPLAPLDVEWRHLALTCMLFNVVALVFSAIFVVESPRWYLARSQDIDAIDSLMTLRGEWGDHELVAETAGIISRENAKTSPPGSFAAFSAWHLLSKSSLLRAITMSCALVAIQQFGGVSLAMHNDDEIPSSGSLPLGENTRLAYVITLMLGILLCSRMIDLTGRKSCMTASLVGMCVANVTMVLVGFFADDLTQNVLSGALVVFAFSFGVGMAATPMLISAESFPQHARATAVSVVSTILWTYVFIESFAYKMAIDSFSARTVHTFFACVCALGVVYVSRVVPETSGLSLEDAVALTAPADASAVAFKVVTSASKSRDKNRSSRSSRHGSSNRLPGHHAHRF